MTWQMTDNKPFWKYSPSNIHGNVPHPKTVHMRERVLRLWAAMHTWDEIAEETGLATETIRTYIKRSRKTGDPRAVKRKNHWAARSAKAARRAEQIVLMHKAGMPPAKIAKSLGISYPLVYQRIKEAKQ